MELTMKKKLDQIVIEVEEELVRIIADLIWFVAPKKTSSKQQIYTCQVMGHMTTTKIYQKYAIITYLTDRLSILGRSEMKSKIAI